MVFARFTKPFVYVNDTSKSCTDGSFGRQVDKHLKYASVLTDVCMNPSVVGVLINKQRLMFQASLARSDFLTDGRVSTKLAAVAASTYCRTVTHNGRHKIFILTKQG